MNNIESKEYSGYIWMSDEDCPIKYENSKFDKELNIGDNPYVIEGNLISTDGEISYSIKYIDGQYRVNKYVLADYKKMESTDYNFWSNKLGCWLGFKQIWRECKDQLCLNMGVLQPAEYIFTGLRQQNNSDTK